MAGPRRRERCPIFFFLRDSANLSFVYFFFPAAAGGDAVRFKPSESTKRLGGPALWAATPQNPGSRNSFILLRVNGNTVMLMNAPPKGLL